MSKSSEPQSLEGSLFFLSLTQGAVYKHFQHLPQVEGSFQNNSNVPPSKKLC